MERLRAAFPLYFSGVTVKRLMEYKNKAHTQSFALISIYTVGIVCSGQNAGLVFCNTKHFMCKKSQVKVWIRIPLKI